MTERVPILFVEEDPLLRGVDEKGEKMTDPHDLWGLRRPLIGVSILVLRANAQHHLPGLEVERMLEKTLNSPSQHGVSFLARALFGMRLTYSDSLLVGLCDEYVRKGGCVVLQA